MVEKYNQNQKLFVFIGYIVGYIGLQVALLTGYTLYQSMNGVALTEADLIEPGIYVTLISSVVTMIGLILFTRKGFVSDFKKLFNTKNIWLIILGGVALMYAVNIGLGLIYELAGITGTSDNQAVLESLITTNPLAMFLPVAIFIPIIEEILFRGVILEFFEKRWGMIMGVIASSLLFGLMHVPSISSMVFLPIYFSLGAVLAFIYLKTNKNIMVPIVAHIINNGLSLVLVLITSGLQ